MPKKDDELRNNPGKGRRGVEVRPQQAVDQLLRGGWHGAAALQRGTLAQVAAVRLALAAAQALQPDQGQAGAHEDHKGTLNHCYTTLTFFNTFTVLCY